MCIGIHMATIEMKLMLATLVNRYDVRLYGEGNATRTPFLAFMPKAGAVQLVFKRRD